MRPLVLHEQLVSGCPLSSITASALRASIDFTLLDPNADEDAIRQVCAQAREGQYASVCVRPVWVPLVVELLKGSGVKVCAVVSFHEGSDTFDAKEAEARWCIESGADEVDWVFTWRNIISNFDGRSGYTAVHREVEVIAALACEFPRVIWKVIVETCALEDHHKRWICELLARTNVIQFIKTSTGYGTPRAEGVPKGATVEDVVMFAGIIAACGSPMQIKASGGIRTLKDLRALWEAGARRFGVGHEGAKKIVAELEAELAA
jgi:deoxyribose-phosphate aldolase